MTRDVVGHCPACGRETLFLGPSDRVYCRAYDDCPRPTAAHELLHDSETGHVVEVRAGDFTVRHPLIERLDDALMACTITAEIAGLEINRLAPGRYRATRKRATWAFEPAPEPAT